MSDKDCPTCKYSYKAECRAPEYLSMSHQEQQVFWKEKTPCRLWAESQKQVSSTSDAAESNHHE